MVKRLTHKRFLGDHFKVTTHSHTCFAHLDSPPTGQLINEQQATKDLQDGHGVKLNRIQLIPGETRPLARVQSPEGVIRRPGGQLLLSPRKSTLEALQLMQAAHCTVL